MNISIDTGNGIPIYRQIANQVRYMVASKLLRPGEELPPIRTLAQQLKVTPNTVVKAYEELERVGVISKRRGAGCFVSDGHSRIAEREKRLLLKERIDAMLVEAQQLDYSRESLFKLIHKRIDFMDERGKLGNASGGG